MAGWRVGMVLGKPKLYQPNIESKKQYGFWNVLRNSKRSHRSIEFIDDWFLAQNKIYKERRDLVWQLADALNCTYDTKATGLFVWAKIPEGKKSEAVTDSILYDTRYFYYSRNYFR